MPAFGTILLLIEYGFWIAARLILPAFPAILLDEHTSSPMMEPMSSKDFPACQ